MTSDNIKLYQSLASPNSRRVRIFVAEGRAIAGPYDYEQIPALVERSVLRVKNFFTDLNERPGEVCPEWTVTFVARSRCA